MARFGLCPSCWFAVKLGASTGAGLAFIVGGLFEIWIQLWR